MLPETNSFRYCSPKMSDALSALSLLLTAFAVLFGLWQPTAASALGLRPERHRASRNGQIGEVWRAFCFMAALLIVAGALAGVFLPRAWEILFHAVNTRGRYDDLRTAFVAAETILLALLILVVIYVARLAKLLLKLRSANEIDPDA
jgi:uncharacterized membrane protein YjgN (DUF898 family)